MRRDESGGECEYNHFMIGGGGATGRVIKEEHMLAKRAPALCFEGPAQVIGLTIKCHRRKGRLK